MSEKSYDDLLDTEQVKAFYQNFPGMLKQVFVRPIDGLREMFAKGNEKAFFQGALLIATTFVIALIIPWLLIKGLGLGTAIKLSVVMVLVLLAISAGTYGLKAGLGEAPADFGNELLVGGICGIAHSILILVMGIFSLIDPLLILKLMAGSSEGPGLFVFLVTIFFFVFMFNVVTQSLKAGKVSDVATFYLAPLLIVLAHYLVFRISVAVLG